MGTRGRIYIPALAITIALLFAAAWWWMAHRRMDFLDGEYGVYLAKMKMADTSEPSDTVAILGDSCTVADLIPPLIGDNVINLGLGGATPIEAYFMAKRFLKRNQPRAIVLSFTPMHLANIDRFGSHTNIFDRAAKFGLLDGNDLEDIRVHSRALKDYSIFGPPAPLDIDARLKVELMAHGFPAYYFGDLINGKINSWKYETPRRLAVTLQTRGYFGGRDANRPGNLDGNAALTNLGPAPAIDYYFRQMLGLFQQRGIPTYIVSMPITQDSLAAMKPEVKEAYAAYFEECAGVYPVLKELGDPLTSMASGYFRDDIHLATSGATLCSGRTRELLVKAGVALGPVDPRWQPPGQ